MVIHVLLVDDHPIVLSGLVALVSSDPGLQVVATARSVAEAERVTAEVVADVALVDLQLPDGDGIVLGGRLKQVSPSTRVVVLTMHADDHAVLRCLGAGLDGYLLKDADPEDILSAVHTAAGGTMVLGAGATAAVVAAAGTATAGLPGPLDALDARDLEVLGHLARGLTTSQVAATLFLAPKTIRNRVSDIVGKLEVGSREEAITMARSAGLGSARAPRPASP